MALSFWLVKNGSLNGSPLTIQSSTCYSETLSLSFDIISALTHSSGCSGTIGPYSDQRVELLISVHNLETPVRIHKLFLEQKMTDVFVLAEACETAGGQACFPVC